MTPNEYQRLAISKQADQEIIRQRIYASGTLATQLENAARGLADDSGELSSCVKKWLEYGQPLDLTNLKEEIGDCLWRLCQACDAVGFTLEEVMEANLAKLKIRYGDGICEPDKAKEEARDRSAEREAVRASGFTFDYLEQTANQGREMAEKLMHRVTLNFNKSLEILLQSLGATEANKHQWIVAEREVEGWIVYREAYHNRKLLGWAGIRFQNGSFMIETSNDGSLVKSPGNSYSTPCSGEGCRNFVHKNNRGGYCGDCAADIRAGRRTNQGKLSDQRAQDDGVNYGNG